MADFGYSARLAVTVTPKYVPRELGVGAAIAEGVGQLAQTVGGIAASDERVNEQVAESEARIAEIEKRRWRASTASTLMSEYADFQVDLDAQIEAARKAAPPGAQGYEASAREVIDKAAADFLGRIPDDPELQERFRPLVSNLSARTILGERSWEQGVRAKHAAASWEKWQTTSSGKLYAEPTGAGFAGFIAEGDAAIDLMDADETVKAALRDHNREVGVRSLFTGLIDSGRQDVVKAAIEGGQFDAYLGDDAKSAWLGKVKTASRIAENEAAATANEARRAALEQAKQVQARIKGGDDVSPGDANDAIAAMRAAGVPESEILTFGYLVEDATVAQSLRGYSTASLQQRQSLLQGKTDAGKATAAEKRELGLIEDQLDSRTTKASDELGKLWKGGPQERMQALAQVNSLPAGLRTEAAAKVSVQMQLLSQLGPRNQVLALQGAELRKDRGDDFLPEKTAKFAKPVDAVRAIAREYLGDTLNDIGGVSDDLMDAALDLMAGSRAANGRADGWHRGDFLAALRGVTGGTRRADGSWQGGIGTVGRFRVELPAKTSEQEFARLWARSDFTGAQYASGAEVNAEDVRRHFRPRYFDTVEGVTRYALQGPNGVLYSQTTGEPYLWGVRN